MNICYIGGHLMTRLGNGQDTKYLLVCRQGSGRTQSTTPDIGSYHFRISRSIISRIEIDLERKPKERESCAEDAEGAHQMRRQQNLGAVVYEILEGWYSCTNAGIIADVLGVVHGDVEVRTHEDALALHKMGVVSSDSDASIIGN